MTDDALPSAEEAVVTDDAHSLAIPVTEHVATIRREGDLVLAAVGRSDLEAVVPTCPDWTLRELVHHLGRVHHWAAAHIEQARSTPLTDEEEAAAWGAMPADVDLADWYAAANARLATALDRAPADLECWSFLPAPSPLAFWARRQAHETTIHRMDAEAVSGGRSPVAGDVALDGIDELLCGFMSRGRRLRSETPRTLAVTAEASGRTVAWLWRVGPDGPRASVATPLAAPVASAAADCTLSGPADAVYRALWNRGRLTDLDVTGDLDLLRLWAEKAQVRWS